MSNSFILKDAAGKSRCWWCGGLPIYQEYHDQEWGRPVKNDRRLFEKICLEGFQSGLSWITILKKRENFRDAFDNFELERVANFGVLKVNQLLNNEGIIRHRGKIEATINNAQQSYAVLEQHGSLAKFFWQFEPKKASQFDAKRATTDESVQMSKQLKKMGWKFVGHTTCYSFMQSMGMVNDHHPECDSWSIVESLRKKFKRP